MDNKAYPERRYIGRVWQAINRYESLLNGPSLIVGDFNWNTIWDKSTLRPCICLRSDSGLFTWITYSRR
jgi:hypothetical protein